VPCIQVTATPIGPMLFQVMARYAIDVPGVTVYPDPLNTPPRYRLTFAKSTEQVDCDALGEPLVNVNKEGFDPPPTMEVYNPVVMIEMVKASFDAYQAMEYVNTVNGNSLGFSLPAIGPGRARLIEIVPTDFLAMNPQGVETTYWRTCFHIAMRSQLASDTPSEKTWWRRVREEGFYAKDPDDQNKLKRIREVDDDGKHFNPDKPERVVPTDLRNDVGHEGEVWTGVIPKCYWNYQPRYVEKDWTPLGITA